LNYAIYSRKSICSENGESIENQINMCREYIDHYCYITSDDTVTVYEDEGFSGRDTNRPQFLKMLHDMRTGHIGCIVCYRLDRISRSISDFAPFVEELNKLGVSLICIREKFDTATPMGKAMIYIASIFAQLERETIAERVRDNMLMLARDGRWLGGTVPVGFRSDKCEYLLLDGRKKCSFRLYTVPEEIKNVIEIYERFLERKQLSYVVEYLNLKGAVSRNRKPFTISGIREILKNPVYCTADIDSYRYFIQLGAEVCFSSHDFSSGLGILPYNRRSYSRKGCPRNPEKDWIIALGKHNGIIPGAKWVQIQKLFSLRFRGSNSTPSAKAPAILSNMLYCSICKEKMYVKRRNHSSNEFDYICSNKMLNGASACKCKNLPGKYTDRLTIKTIIDKVLLKFIMTKTNNGRYKTLIEKMLPTCKHIFTSDEISSLLRILVTKITWDGTYINIYL
jgi:site-specific DNA recombinase